MARWNRLVAYICFFLCFQIAVGRALVPIKRQEDSATAITSTRTGTARDGGPTTSSVPSARSATTTATNTLSLSASSTLSSSATMPTASDDTTFDNSTLFNSTIPDGQLPLEPQITPGWAVAGVILMCVGLAYTLIGIRHPAMHNALSVAYVVGLGITVLVVYLIPLPVSNASQGGLVVAAVLPGVLVGVVASLWFKEITECFACALGGFCFSMWLLCLHEGGLLSGLGKVIFIIVLTLSAFAAFFTRWTRDWALITTISFAGATSIVLGIDCFSKAGLKEFWAYIWHLNEHLFPQGVTTYPMTKGIRVELAAIVVVFCVGIISQKRLWNVIKDRRAKRQEELAEERRARDEEEINIGKQIEAETARERRAWERVHGDHDSGFARDSESEKGAQYSPTNSAPGSEPLLVAEMPGSEVPPAVPTKTTPRGLMTSEKEKAGMVTVRVAPDGTPADSDVAKENMDEKEVAVQTTEINDQGIQEAATPVPEVVPLPFKFPIENDRPKSRASTVATFADDDEVQTGVVSNRSSFAKHLSQSSTMLMRKDSQRTAMSHQQNGPSEEELAVFRKQRKDDDNGSMAATIDSENDSGESTLQEVRHRSVELNVELADKESALENHKAASVKSAALPEEDSKPKDCKHVSSAETLSDDAPSKSTIEQGVVSDNTTEESQAEPSKNEVSEETTTESNGTKEVAKNEALSQKAKSVDSVHSTPVNLTEERLPPALSNVALHYRTNEWAKHLSHADVPVPEKLSVVEYPDDEQQKEESPVPVNVEELKQTALTATPAPARPMSTYAPAHSHLRNGSTQSGFENPAFQSPTMRHPDHQRVSSKNQIPTVQSIAEGSIHVTPRAPSTKSGSSGRMSAGPSPTTQAGFERPPPPPGVMSYDSPQSLIAQRSVVLRNKTYGILTGANTMTDLSATGQRPVSEVGSVYNYPAYSPQAPAASFDDLPLSQRKELIRRQSSLSTNRSSMIDQRSASGVFMPSMPVEQLQFDSHQPIRHSNTPSQEAREARLASFRNSVRADLRNGMAVAPPAAGGRDMSMMLRTSSSPNMVAQTTSREADMQRNIDLQRSFLMSQKDAEAKRRERERMEKERADQAFTRSMQAGDMFDLHRDALRRMQQGAKNT
ncbi:uncharacterized protein CTRU02_212597 [Colletotrichum truncatum]|uniref:Uncharacterized protein n=1 Tax=Colletotrichum truncatum TaxID=5467 RepID=A0ACC3YIB3_COLTU|nr:uncharacterized protein CTRU02_05329 [Colletotrichum truncatum]KAF6794497.1 hypothetical protein CTRU02_05329 [Colletotrichum truncatum]